MDWDGNLLTKKFYDVIQPAVSLVPDLTVVPIFLAANRKKQ